MLTGDSSERRLAGVPGVRSEVWLKRLEKLLKVPLRTGELVAIGTGDPTFFCPEGGLFAANRFPKLFGRAGLAVELDAPVGEIEIAI